MRRSASGCGISASEWREIQRAVEHSLWVYNRDVISRISEAARAQPEPRDCWTRCLRGAHHRIAFTRRSSFWPDRRSPAGLDLAASNCEASALDRRPPVSRPFGSATSWSGGGSSAWPCACCPYRPGGGRRRKSVVGLGRSVRRPGAGGVLRRVGPGVRPGDRDAHHHRHVSLPFVAVGLTLLGLADTWLISGVASSTSATRG